MDKNILNMKVKFIKNKLPKYLEQLNKENPDLTIIQNFYPLYNTNSCSFIIKSEWIIYNFVTTYPITLITNWDFEMLKKQLTQAIQYVKRQKYESKRSNRKNQ